MKKLAFQIQTLIISEITGSITKEEQEMLNLLRDQHTEIQDLSNHLHQQLKGVSIPKPADRSTKNVSDTGSITTIQATSGTGAKKSFKKRAIPAITTIAAAIGLLITFRSNSNTISFKQKLDINNQKTINLKLISLKSDTSSQKIQGQSLTVNKNGKITTSEGIVFNTADLFAEKIAVSVPPGGLYQLKLSDGTKVAVNSQSTITFPAVFGSRREVTLVGEAYFEVAKNVEKPFIIHTTNTETIALGTAFNVNSYDSEKVIVSLTNGEVKVSGNGTQVNLHPDSAATYENGDFQVDRFDADKLLGWAKGKMHMQSESTQEIVDAAARYLDIKVEFSHPITGQAGYYIERNKPARAFLEQFKNDYTIDSSNNTYYLK